MLKGGGGGPKRFKQIWGSVGYEVLAMLKGDAKCCRPFKGRAGKILPCLE